MTKFLPLLYYAAVALAASLAADAAHQHSPTHQSYDSTLQRW
ncbi:hypothetical protein [Paludibacterium denitrificans]|nr:hypothetical protein [Paludibacterium denitrificans]